MIELFDDICPSELLQTHCDLNDAKNFITDKVPQ